MRERLRFFSLFWCESKSSHLSIKIQSRATLRDPSGKLLLPSGMSKWFYAKKGVEKSDIPRAISKNSFCIPGLYYMRLYTLVMREMASGLFGSNGIFTATQPSKKCPQTNTFEIQSARSAHKDSLRFANAQFIEHLLQIEWNVRNHVSARAREPAHTRHSSEMKSSCTYCIAILLCLRYAY
jgi:hypothetical protein